MTKKTKKNKKTKNKNWCLFFSLFDRKKLINHIALFYSRHQK